MLICLPHPSLKNLVNLVKHLLVMEVIIMILCKFFLLWRNKIIHIICIPLIAATLFSLLSYIPFNYTVDNLPIVGSYTVGFAEVFFVVAMVYYFSLSPLFGVKNIMIFDSLLKEFCLLDFRFYGRINSRIMNLQAI